MRENSILFLTADEVASLLQNREEEVLNTIKRVYEAHAQGEDVLPHSLFLRPFKASSRRFIALPSYLGKGFELAGMKWVSSFPDNTKHGIERASAVTILNSIDTGRPLAVLEGSVISAKRTAASAALAAQCLKSEMAYTALGIIGCGIINFEIFRFISKLYPELRTFILYDINRACTLRFKDMCSNIVADAEYIIVSDIKAIFETAPLVALATTSSAPYISSIAEHKAGNIILHISLRDLSPEIILANDNVVDDIDHVSREQTSIHLAEQQTQNHDFIRCTLGDILLGNAAARQDRHIRTIFSPFGLGGLDIGVARLVYDLACSAQIGTEIPAFFPTIWR